MKNTFYFIISIIILACFYNACSDDPVKGGGNNNTQDTAILYADEFGNILGGDTTDWCLNNPGGFRFGHAWPNPCSHTVMVRFFVPGPDTVKIYFLNAPGDSTVIYRDAVNYGTFDITINNTNNSWVNTVKRVYIQSKVNSSSAYCRFYGDIRFTE